MRRFVLLLLIIPLIWQSCFIGLASGQSESIVYQAEGGKEDWDEIARRLQDYEVLKQMEAVYKARVANLESKIDLMEQEIRLKDQMIDLKDKEIAMERRSFEAMKEVADRAFKLAEAKKTNLWES